MQLLNARHEIFCQRIAAGMAGSRAYVAAGYTTKISAAEACASRLLRKDKVRARISELLAGVLRQSGSISSASQRCS